MADPLEPLPALTPDELGVSPLGPAPVAPAIPPSPLQDPHQRALNLGALALMLMGGQRFSGLGAGILQGQHGLETDRLRQMQLDAGAHQRALAEFDRQQRAQQAESDRRQSLLGSNVTALRTKMATVGTQEEADQLLHAFAQGLQSQGLRGVTADRLSGMVGPFKGAQKLADEALDDYEKKPAIQQTFQQNPELLWNSTILVNGRPMLYKEAWKLSGRPMDPQGNPLATPTLGPAQQKSVLLDGKPAEVFFDPKNRKYFDGNNQEITNAAGRVRPMPPASVLFPQQGTDASAIADAIIRGEQPPTLQGLYRQGASVRTELAKRGFNLAAAQTDWNATQKHLATLNGSQQTRLRQAIETAKSSLDVIDNLASEWKGGNFPILNRANLAIAKHGGFGAKAASIATQLEGQITDVVSELGNVYMGGNSPTDHALHLASQNLNGAWSEKVLRDMIGLARTNLQIRSNSILNSGVIGATDTNPYGPKVNPIDPAASGRNKLSSR